MRGVVVGHRETLPRGVEDGGGRIGGDGGRDGGGVGFVKSVAIKERARAVFGDVAASGAGFVEAGEEGVLALAAFDFFNRGGLSLFQIGALMPDAREGVIAALADGPDDDSDGLVGAFEVDGRVVQAGARDEEERAKCGVGFLTNANRFAEGTAAEQGEIGVRGGAALTPVVVDVIARIEGEGVGRASRDVRGEAARAVGLALHKIPKGHAAGRPGDGGDAIGGGRGRECCSDERAED